MLDVVSTIMDDPTMPPPSEPGHPAAGPILRRSTDDRVLVGLAGGLGRYFRVDPILFRVLFAVSAFFGGIGVLAYLVGWALIPEEGAVEPPVDRLVEQLRRRGVAFWVVVGVLSVMFWVAVIPSWQPLGFGPIAIAVVIVAIALSQRSSARAASATGTGAAAGPVAGPVPGTPAAGAPGASVEGAGVIAVADTPTEPLVAETPGTGPAAATEALVSDAPTAEVPTEATPLTGSTATAWAGADPTTAADAWAAPPAYTVQDPTQAFGPPPDPPDVRRWEAQARVMAARTAARESQRAARQERRRRMAPARWGSFGLLVLSLATVAVLDAARGVPLATYGWVLLGVGLVSLVVGGLFRRTPWLNVLWVLVGLSIIFTFGTTPASLADGSGDRLLVPRSAAALPDDVRLAFGRTTLDLTELPAGAGRGQTVDLRQGAGAIVIRVPEGMRVAIHAGVHLGAVVVDPGGLDGSDETSRQIDEGPAGGRALTIDAHLAVGVIEVDHVTKAEQGAADGDRVTTVTTTPADPTSAPDGTGSPEPTAPPTPGSG